LRQGVVRLEQFYASKRGRATKTMVARRLHALWPHLEGLDVLSYGYGLHYLEEYEKGAHSVIYAMPGGQGAACHLSRRGNSSVLVPEDVMPFPPVSFDRVLIAHGFEESPDLQTLLSELWRVMKPEGRIVIMAASRTGLWARSDKTPFGAGRPFSRSQLSNALKKAQFVPLVRAGALYTPPLNSFCGPRMTITLEKFGETVCPGFSGLVLVEAVKRLYAGHERRMPKRVLRPSFAGPGALGIPGKIKNTAERDEQE
jgi:SAM-dependent methyltransferase